MSSSCGLRRMEHFLTVPLQISLFRCPAASMGLGMASVSILIPAGFILRALPWDSPPHIPFQVWIKPAGLKTLMCVCPWCCRQIRSKIPAELLLLALGSSMGRKAPGDSSCLALLPAKSQNSHKALVRPFLRVIFWL